MMPVAVVALMHTVHSPRNALSGQQCVSGFLNARPAKILRGPCLYNPQIKTKATKRLEIDYRRLKRGPYQLPRLFGGW